MKTVFAATAIATAVLTSPPANAGDDLMLQTVSGKTLCSVTSSNARCQGAFAGMERVGNTVWTAGDGAISWTGANLPTPEHTTYMTMTYGQTITYGNWSVYPDETGTRFTNTSTGHGMFVSVHNVYAF